MLPNPSKDFIKTANDEIFKYIWNDKPDRIKRAQFKQNYENGGVKMPDIESHINALKINWIRRIALGDQKWIKLFRICMNVISDDIYCIGLCRFNTMENKIDNKFWHDTLLSWSSLINIVNKDNLDFNRIAKQYLWWNDKIKIGGKPVCYANWKKRGVLFINDLLNENGSFMSKDEFSEVYNVRTNFLEYYGIIRAIQSNFHINSLNSTKMASPFRPSNMELLFKQCKGCKIFYDVFVVSKKGKMTRNKWQTEFEIDNNEWKDICVLNFKCTTDTKYRWFQYRINHSIIGTNSLLLKMKLKNDDLCTFCKATSETIRHLFIDCQISRNFWNNIKIWIEEKSNINVNMTPFFILFGSKYDPILTLIIIMAKFHLYRAKMMEKEPNLQLFKQEIKYYYKVLKYQATCNLKLKSFLQKWQSWQVLVN